MAGEMSRRKFIQLGLAAALGYGVAACTPFSLEKAGDEKEPGPEKVSPPPAENGEGLGRDPSESPEPPRSLPRRALGQTGFQAGIFALGGSFTIARNQERADTILNRALDLGVNYVDTAPSYGGSEANIGRALHHRRQEFFLASKTLDRTYEGTLRLFRQSLKRLKTDRLDLLQLHGVHTQKDLDQALGKQGAIKALEELKKDGHIGFTGITGHRDPQVLLQAIKEYPFDCLLLPLNAADPHFRPFSGELLQEAVNRGLGIIAMKVASYGRIFKDGGISTMEQALSYVLDLPVSTAIVGVSSLEEVEENIRIATHFAPLSRERRAYLEDLVKPYYREANFFKTSW